MTRLEIMQAYTVNAHGIITSPGKFEGEVLYAPYAYDVTLDGCCDSLDFNDGEHIDYFEIDLDDVQQFPELAGDVGRFLAVTESDQGFVTVTILTQKRIAELCAEAEAEESIED